jgi:hypothetical protein
MGLYGLTLSASSGFVIASGTCGTALGIAASCTAQIAFTPASAGQRTGYLTVASTELAAPAQVSLAGMGADFSMSSQGQSSKTVASGQTASFVVALTPMSGSSGTFTFACNALPSNSSCTFNPVSETVAANTSGSVTVDIATGVAVASAQRQSRRGEAGISGKLFLVLAVLMVPPAIFRRRYRTALSRALLLSIVGLASCAGSGGGGGTGPVSPVNNTPAGTYSVVVTANAGGVLHKVTLTLTVD